MAKATKADVEKARAALLAVLKPGDTLYGIFRSHSTSGTVAISPIVIKGGEPLWPAWAVAAVTGYAFIEKNGYNAVRMKGYGYNRIDHLADAVSYAIFGKGNLLKGRML